MCEEYHHVTHCFKCCEPLKDFHGVNQSSHNPLGGASFISKGVDGSTYFEPKNGSTLELAICDDCLIEYFGQKTLNGPYLPLT